MFPSYTCWLGVIYVGSTQEGSTRFNTHLREVRGRANGLPVYRRFRAYPAILAVKLHETAEAALVHEKSIIRSTAPNGNYTHNRRRQKKSTRRVLTIQQAGNRAC